MKKILFALVIVFVIASMSFAANSSTTRELFKAVKKESVTSRQINSLIKRGADINAYDKEGETPLMYAVRNNNYEAVKALINAGVNVNAQAKSSGTTALMLTGMPVMPGEEALVKIIKALVKAGADLNMQDSSGETALISMCGGGSNPKIETIKLFIEAGADVNAANNAGQTALMSIAANIWCEDSAKIAQLLIDEGADPNAKDIDGNTVLYYAEDNDDEEVKKVLMRAMKNKI